MTNHKTRFSAIAVLAAAMLSGSIDDGVAANRSASEQELDTAKKTVVTPEEPKVRDEVEVATLENTEVQAILEQLLDPKAKPEALLPLLTDLGARGPDAEPTLDVLLDPAFYTAKVKRNPAMKKAVVDILVSIGRPSIDAVLNLKSEKAEQKQEARANTPRPETKEDSKSAKKQSNKIAALTKEMQEEANDLLRSMVLHGLGDEVIEEIERSLMPKKKLNGADWARLALMGPKSAPALKRLMIAKRRFDVNLIGAVPEVAETLTAQIPEQYTLEDWNPDNKAKRVRVNYSALSHISLDSNRVRAVLGPVVDERFHGSDHYETAWKTGMMLSHTGAVAAEPLTALLKDKDPQVRRSAASILGMIGPEMKSAIPALQSSYRNEGERVDVRIAAARAVATITQADPATLYREIPNAQEEIVALTRQLQKRNQNEDLWEKHITSDSTGTRARHLALYSWTKAWEKPLYYLMIGQDVKAQNQIIRNMIEPLMDDPDHPSGFTGSVAGSEAHLFVLLFGENSRFYPGRLEANVEALLREFCFKMMNAFLQYEDDLPGKGPRYSIKTSYYFKKQLAKDDTARILEMSNGPMRFEANQHLVLQILKDDPEFAQRKFPQGDTVSERYDLSAKIMAKGMKGLALHGMWTELGSSNYEHKTYRGLLALAEFATDPVVAKRAKMFLDLAMMEIEQISISNLRAGSKSRAKDGGLSARFNRVLSMLHGEYQSKYEGYGLEPIGFKPYQPPVPAIFFRKFGPTTPVYEIANRHVGERETLLSRSLNYAYCTPEYITGCAMYDVRLWSGEGKTRQLNYGTMGRWSGVIFRDRAAIELPAYTGEKYNAQDKDVMIAQIYRGSKYSGKPQINFVSINKMEERGGWVFIENQEAYAAVRPAREGYYWSQPARRTMYLNDEFSPIIIQTGRKAVYGSFAAFQQAILAAPLAITEDVLDYTGPNSSRIEFYMCKDVDGPEAYPKHLPTIDGKELDLMRKTNYKSPFINSAVGSDVVTVTYGDRTWDYDFENNSVTEK